MDDQNLQGDETPKDKESVVTKNWLKNPWVWLYAFLVVIFLGVTYFGYPDPKKGFGLNTGRMTIFFLLIVFVVEFIRLFTKPVLSEGELTPNEKVRTHLIRYSYVFMFFAIGVAIIPFMSNIKPMNPNLPIAVFLGCSEGNKVPDLACPKDETPPTSGQWVVNIGGHVKCSADDKGACRVKGGIVVPLYFVILALMAGAISISRRVPEYQKRSAPIYVGTEKEPKLGIGTLREFLVFQIIQFVSAPLIAVVAFYFVPPTQKPYAVALGFTAGFASESILVMIRAVVDKVKPGASPVVQKGAASGIVIDSESQKGVGGAEILVVGQSGLKTQADGNGHFIIDGIPVGERVIEASKEKRRATAKVTVGAGKISSCHITIP